MAALCRKIVSESGRCQEVFRLCHIDACMAALVWSQSSTGPVKSTGLASKDAGLHTASMPTAATMQAQPSALQLEQLNGAEQTMKCPLFRQSASKRIPIRSFPSSKIDESLNFAAMRTGWVCKSHPSGIDSDCQPSDASGPSRVFDIWISWCSCEAELAKPPKKVRIALLCRALEVLHSQRAHGWPSPSLYIIPGM